ncbi:MAG: hypothetical protein AAB554_01740 [Patescibacteria group bacterium]|mgnify:CR=1 FL=1
MPIVYAVFAYAFYASQAYLLEQKTSSFTPAALLVQLYVVGLVLSCAYLLVTKAGGTHVAWPSGGALKWVLLGGVVFFLADNLYVLAFYTAQRSGEEYLFAIVGAAVLFPVFGTIIKYVGTGKTPNGWHLAAYAVAALMLGLTIMGNKIQRDREAAASAPVETHP